MKSNTGEIRQKLFTMIKAKTRLVQLLWF